MVQDLPKTISSSKSTSFRSYEIFTHLPQANTVTSFPQNGQFGRNLEKKSRLSDEWQIFLIDILLDENGSGLT